MAGADLSSLSNILKEYYLGPVAEQLNNEVLLLSRLESKSEDLVGKRAYVPLHYGRSAGIGARAEAAMLPTAGNQKYDKAVYDLKYLYGRVEVTGPSMAKTKNELGAFLQALKSELDGVRNDLRKDLARQVYGDGTGAIAEIDTVSTNDLILTSAESLRKGQIYVGMTLDGWSGGSKTTTSGFVTVSDVDVATATITVDDASELSAGDVLLRSGVQQYSPTVNNTYSKSDEVDGLQRIVSDSGTAAFGGIDPAGSPAAPWWGNQTVAVNGALALDDIQQGLNKARIAGGMPTSIVTSLGIQREVYNLLAQYVQYIDPQSLSYASGFKMLTYNGMPIIADIDAPYGKMYVLDEATMKVFSDQDWHFLDADGLTLRLVSGHDKFEAILARYMNLGATRRNNQIVLTGITVDNAADVGY